MTNKRKTRDDKKIGESESFADLISGVKPYSNRLNKNQTKITIRPKVKKHLPSQNNKIWDDYLPENELISYKRPGVQDRVTKRLKRGTYRVNAELDLHGLTLAEARVQLFQFLDNVQTQRTNCILIIHGKGLNSRSAKSVLRPHVRNWLTQDERTLAFTEAPKNMGAAGATYALLRGMKKL